MPLPVQQAAVQQAVAGPGPQPPQVGGGAQSPLIHVLVQMGVPLQIAQQIEQMVVRYLAAQKAQPGPAGGPPAAGPGPVGPMGR